MSCPGSALKGTCEDNALKLCKPVMALQHDTVLHYECCAHDSHDEYCNEVLHDSHDRHSMLLITARHNDHDSTARTTQHSTACP